MRIGRLPRPSIARPLLAGGAIRVKASNSRYYRGPTGDNGNGLDIAAVLNRADAKTIRIILMRIAYRQPPADGQWPPLRPVFFAALSFRK